jgi:hypothetical protein
VGWAVDPSIAGLIMQRALAGPLLVGAGLKSRRLRNSVGDPAESVFATV